MSLKNYECSSYLYDTDILTKILKNYGSPCYVYDKKILEKRCNDMKNFQDILEKELSKKVSMHYSTKANSNPTILQIVEQSGLSVDAMSPVELLLDRNAGFSSDRILYVCNNISAEEMKFVHDKGVLVCLDSISQVDTWGKNLPNTDIMVRINPGTAGVGHSKKVETSGKDTKFGISEANLPELIETANKYHLRIVGTHQHLGSLFLNDKIDDYIEGVKTGLDIVKNNFKDIKIVDLGGGFGVPYNPNTEKPLDLFALSNKLIPILKDFIKSYPSVDEFKFEPGRYIPCESGKVIGTVTAVKLEYGMYWIGTDIGMNVIIRPAMYGSYHHIEVLHKNPQRITSRIYANICGNVCESGDVLGKKRIVELPEVGDRVVVYNCGAYGYTMSSNYTGRPRPAEVMVDESNITLIRKKEELSDLII